MGKSKGLVIESRILDRHRFRWRKLLGKRVLGCLSLLFVVAVARLQSARQLGQVFSKTKTAKTLLAYTSFPRSWTTRKGVWQDMYYGDFLEAVGHTEEIQPAYVQIALEVRRWVQEDSHLGSVTILRRARSIWYSLGSPKGLCTAVRYNLLLACHPLEGSQRSFQVAKT